MRKFAITKKKDKIEEQHESKENDANIYGLCNEMLINKMNESHKKFIQMFDGLQKNDERRDKIHQTIAEKKKEIYNNIDDDKETQSMFFFVKILFWFCFL